jgi:uncharacterized protein (TIGR02231 family)
MNRLFLNYFACLLSAFGMLEFCQAQGDAGKEGYSQWEIDSVAVYESGALIKRSSNLRLDETGQVSIQIGGLAKSVDAASIQIVLPADWGLSGHSFQISPRPMTDDVSKKKLSEWKASSEATERILAMRNSLLAVYSEELLMIQANRKAGGTEVLLVEDLIELSDFWRTRVKELEYLMLDLRLEMKELQDELIRLAELRDGLLKAMNEDEGQIALRVFGPRNGSGLAEISYVVQDAFWRAAYDAEVSEGSVLVRRYAEVIQNTGIEWDDLPLKFIAGNPLESISPPSLVPLELSLIRRDAGNRIYSREALNTPAQFEKPVSLSINGIGASESLSKGGLSLQRLVYTSALPAHVNGDGTPERIYLETLSLESELNYVILPEYADEAFQRVLSTDWNKVQLMPGTVQVVAGGVYRGLYELTLPAPGDTLEIPLGQDVRIRSSRKRILERCSSSVFGGVKKIAQAFEIAIVNQHDRTIKVRIMDRVPISRNADVDIIIRNLDGGVLDSSSGWVTWELTLGPNEQQKRTFSYEVEHPKKFSLEGL